MLLLPFVKACRSYGKLDRPRHAVLSCLRHRVVLDLFCSSCWKHKTGNAKQWADARRDFHSTARALRRDTIHLSRLRLVVSRLAVEFQRRREEANAKPDGSKAIFCDPAFKGQTGNRRSRRW